MKHINNIRQYLNIPIIVFFYILLQVIAVLSSYDANTAQYTPTGRVLQIEYAKKAVEMKGGPIAAIKCEDGILITIGRYISRNKLILNEPQKIFMIDNHIMIAASGSLSEGLQLIQIAKQEALKYKELHGCLIPIENLCEYLSMILHILTLESKHRPVGVSFIISGWDDLLGPQIYSINPEGNSIAWNAIAIGKQSNEIKKSLMLLMKSFVNNKLSIETIYDKYKTIVINKHFDTSIIKSKIQSNHNIKTQPTHSNNKSNKDNENDKNSRNNEDNYGNDNNNLNNINEEKEKVISSSLSDIFEITTDNNDRDIMDDIYERYWKVETYCCMKNSNGNIDWTLVTN